MTESWIDGIADNFRLTGSSSVKRRKAPSEHINRSYQQQLQFNDVLGCGCCDWERDVVAFFNNFSKKLPFHCRLLQISSYLCPCSIQKNGYAPIHL